MLTPSAPSALHAGFYVFGVRLLGFSAENGRKLLVSLALVLIVPLTAWLLNRTIARLTEETRMRRWAFWLRQAISLLAAVIVILGLLSIWFDDPVRLTTAIGLVTAGVAFAMQRVITSIAGYFLILRGNIFNVGDRIVVGGVRGDVAALGFLQTTIMEMGETKSEQPDSPSVWVHSRQYTGRVVTVSNAAVFDQPVYNYTRDLPYIFEEMVLPLSYEDDWPRAEQILLEAARRHTVRAEELEENAMRELRRRYFLGEDNPGPKVYWKLTDNWLEMTVRFVVRDHGVRAVKDAMSREILQNLKSAGIGIASGTYSVVQMPELKVKLAPPAAT